MSTVRYPGESASYRDARENLLRAEIDLRKKTEEVAAMRRALPLGGEVTDYVFDEGAADPADTTTTREVHLADLFEGKSTLVLYSFMYGPAMKQPCPMCTSFLDGLDAQAKHVTQRVALAVSARSPIARVREFARSRGWKDLRLLSSSRSTYQRDYFGENEKGSQLPMMNVFVKQGGKVHHFWGSEMLYAEMDPGQDSRHIDIMWPLWNVLDLTPDGRGDAFRPKLAY